MHTFQTQVEQIADANALKVQLLEEDTVLSYQSVISLWQQSQAFRDFYIAFLSNVPYHAYRWETPPLSLESVHQPFECVIIDSPELDIPPDMTPFANYFDNHSQNDIAIFPNLGKDAWLIAPCPKAADEAYSHLATFIRQAPDYQKHTLWQQVAQLVSTHLDHTPKWLNTAGGGVAWLHIRWDNYPKYYCYSPYKSM